MTESKRVSSRRRGRRAALAAIACLSLPWRAHAAAAELWLGFDDIAAMFDRIAPSWSARVAKDAASRHGAGPTHFELAAGRAERQTLALRMPMPHVELAAGVYRAALGSDLTGTFAIRAQAGGLTVVARSSRFVVFNISCIKGACPPQSTMPDLAWHDPSLEADIVPGASGRLMLRRLAIGGTMAATCNRSWFPGSLVCEALRPLMDTVVEDRIAAIAVAASGAPEKSAGSMARDLAHDVRIAAIFADEAGVRVSFCIAPNCP